MYNRDMGFCDLSNMLFMDHWLMMFVNMFLNDDWLVMFMDNSLMVLVHVCLFVFNKDILVVFVEHVLMDFFHNRLSDVSLHFSAKLMFAYSLSFVDIFVACFLLVLYNNGLFVDNLNNWGSLVLLRSSICL